MRIASPRRRGFSPDLFLDALAEIKGSGLKALLRKAEPNAGPTVGGASAPIFSPDDVSENKGSGLKPLLRKAGAGA
jgi:hypothetical protein